MLEKGIMLRITMSKRSDNAARYFDGQDAREGQAIITEGRWGGKGAARLGLGVQVTRKQFVALGMNRVPGTGKRLTARLKRQRTAGYDMCFAVPKSVSLYIAETGDQAVKKMILESFRETMSAMENQMETRVRTNGRDENRVTGNMVYARFEHDQTRPVNGSSDPHYHIHCYVFNATFDDVEGRWKAGQFKGLKTAAMDYEKMFNDGLASRLVAAGYSVTYKKRCFELASVSPELIKKFSKRTTFIHDLAEKAGGLLNGAARALSKKKSISFDEALADVKHELGARIRDKKESVLFSPNEQLAHWRHQMTAEERESLQTANVKRPTPAAVGAAFGRLKDKKRDWTWKRLNGFNMHKTEVTQER